MNAKRIIHALLFVVFAATSSLASAEAVDAGWNDRPTSAFPYTPVGNPNIE